MSTVQEASAAVTPENTVLYGGTQGTPPEALTWRGVDDGALWREALEAMLSWRSNPEQFEPDDRPDISILDTAIDYAVDVRDLGVSPPSNIVPAGSGRVAFEWCAGEVTLIVELVGSGEAEVTRFLGNRVVEKQRLLRNPQTRKLELES